MQINFKKLFLTNLPYGIIGLYASKLGQAWRLAEGADTSQKIIHLVDGFTIAFQSSFPSFSPRDWISV